MNPPAENPSAKPALIETSKLGVLRLIGWLLVAGPLVFLSVLFFFLPAQPQQAVGPLLILCLASFCLFLIGRKRAMAAALLIVYGGGAAIAAHALVSGGGINTPQLAAMPLGIMLAGWLLGRRHAIAVTTLGVALNLALALLEQAGLAPAVQTLPALLLWLPRAVVAMGVCLLTLYIVHTYEERIGEVRRLGEALAEERTQLRAIAENVPALIFHGDRDMRCLFANRQFADFFHGGGVPLEGMHLREILGNEVFEAALPNVSRALAGESVLLAGERLSKSSGLRHLEISLVPQCGEQGQVIGFYALKRDITGQQRAEDQVRRLNAELESRVRERTAELTAANHELESFAYSISHDLRAPLRGIDGFSHLLAEEYSDRLDEQGRDYLDRVRRAAQRMGTLIDDILELSRVTRQEMRRVRVDLSQIAAELIDECSRAEPHRRVDVSLAAGCSAVGDPQLLRVMMQNLLENAWKYTGKTEKARIDFFNERIDGETVFQVSDNGVGFDMQYAGRLFSPFQRLHSPEEFEGTGIGLATVARVVHRHGGRAWAESAPGEGATFRFTLG
jgi:PAS domain S-box-containing protein